MYQKHALERMIIMHTRQLPIFKDLNPYCGRIDQNNRWIKLAELVPWEEMNVLYLMHFDPQKHSVLKSNRLILGLLLGQMLLDLDDRGIVEYFHENPYFQYFCGQETFVMKLEKAIIHHSLLSKRRKRLGEEYMRCFEKEVLRVLKEKGLVKGNKLMLDATVFPVNINYPSDVKLLNTAREWCCKTILRVKNSVNPEGKIRTYRKTARRVYLNYQKVKRKSRQFINKNKKKMLRFLKRNIQQLEAVIKEYEAGITKTQMFSQKTIMRIKAYLMTAKTIYDQQWHMVTTRGRHVANRIVSLHQPLVRPIVRGKDGKAVEFGPKAQVALVDGFGFLDDCEFNAYNEGIRLPQSIENHKERFGIKPSVIIADQLYATRANRALLKEKEIEHSFKPIGRTPEIPDDNYKKSQSKRRKRQRQRNHIEGFFGTLKNSLRLDRIVWSVAGGANMQVRLGLSAMNLKKAAALT